VIAEGTTFLRLMSLTFGFIGLQIIINGVFQGSGNTFHSMILSIVSLWVLQFPLAYILSKHTVLAETGIWWAFPISNIIMAIIAVSWFLKGTWKSKRITPEIKIKEKIMEETKIEGS